MSDWFDPNKKKVIRLGGNVFEIVEGELEHLAGMPSKGGFLIVQKVPRSPEERQDLCKKVGENFFKENQKPLQNMILPTPIELETNEEKERFTKMSNAFIERGTTPIEHLRKSLFGTFISRTNINKLNPNANPLFPQLMKECYKTSYNSFLDKAQEFAESVGDYEMVQEILDKKSKLNNIDQYKFD